MTIASTFRGMTMTNEVQDFLDAYVSRGGNPMIIWLSGDLEITDCDDLEDYNDILSEYLSAS